MKLYVAACTLLLASVGLAAPTELEKTAEEQAFAKQVEAAETLSHGMERLTCGTFCRSDKQCRGVKFCQTLAKNDDSKISCSHVKFGWMCVAEHEY